MLAKLAEDRDYPDCFPRNRWTIRRRGIVPATGTTERPYGLIEANRRVLEDEGTLVTQNPKNSSTLEKR